VQRGERRRATCQHPATADEPLGTVRLELVPVITDHAEELTEVFSDATQYRACDVAASLSSGRWQLR
jgi:hypothetical protein